MNITVESKIDWTPAMKKIQSDEFWKDAANEWWQAYYDYVPYDTNNLRQNVTIKPKTIIHNVDYAAFIYKGVLMIDPKFKCGGFTGDGGITWVSRYGVKKVVSGKQLRMKNGTRLWDEKAKQEKKDLLVIKSMQKWIERNL